MRRGKRETAQAAGMPMASADRAPDHRDGQAVAQRRQERLAPALFSVSVNSLHVAREIARSAGSQCSGMAVRSLALLMLMMNSQNTGARIDNGEQERGGIDETSDRWRLCRVSWHRDLRRLSMAT